MGSAHKRLEGEPLRGLAMDGLFWHPQLGKTLHTAAHVLGWDAQESNKLAESSVGYRKMLIDSPTHWKSTGPWPGA